MHGGRERGREREGGPRAKPGNQLVLYKPLYTTHYRTRCINHCVDIGLGMIYYPDN